MCVYVSEYLCHRPSRVNFYVVLPDPDYPPPQSSKLPGDAAISRNIFSKFEAPEPRVFPRRHAVSRAPVPETTVHKYDGALHCNHEIRLSGKQALQAVANSTPP